MPSECPYHPQPKYRECHHSGDSFVAIWYADWAGCWLSTYGFTGRDWGSITGREDEAPRFLEMMAQEASRER